MTVYIENEVYVMNVDVITRKDYLVGCWLQLM